MLCAQIFSVLVVYKRDIDASLRGLGSYILDKNLCIVLVESSSVGK